MGKIKEKEEKEYLINFSDGRQAELSIRKRDNGLFTGGIFYTQRKSSTRHKTVLSYKFQKLIGNSEREVLAKCKDWIKENFGEDFQISEKAP